MSIKASVNLPLVSIGVPVFNAERYLSVALDALVAQDYPLLEILILDDGSTDSTAEICKRYTQTDQRFRYQRNQQNIGAAANFNRVFEMSRGEYFMWAAFDDIRYPQYVSKCVAALIKEPNAVMCCTDVRIIDEKGDDFPEEYVTKRPVGSSLTERIDQITRVMDWVDVYSLMRRSALARTRGFLPRFGVDVILLTELCLQGPVLHVPEVLWAARIFRKKTSSAQANTLVPTAGSTRIVVSFTDLACSLLEAIAKSNLDRLTRWKLSIRIITNCAVKNVPFRFRIFHDHSNPLVRAFKARRFRDVARLFVLHGVAITCHLPMALLRRVFGFVRNAINNENRYLA